MKIRFLILTTFLFRMVVYAQEGPKTYTLRQCIDYALVNNTSIKNATIDEYIAKSKVQEYKGTGLPQVTGSAALQQADPLRRIFGVGNGEYSFFANRVIPEGYIYSVPNVFQLSNTADASVTISQLLFSSSFFVGLKAANTYKELATRNKENSQIQTIEAVTKAYYMVLINTERKNIFDINISRVDSLLKQTKVLNKSGFAELLDVNRIEVTYNNLLTEKANFENLVLLSSILLKYQMNMPAGEEIGLSGKISELTIDSALSNSGKVDYTNRVEHKLLNTQLKLEKLNYKNNSLGFLPTLAFNANVGTFSQNTKLSFPTDRFAKYATYTLALNVPIFSGFSRLRRVQQSRLSVEKAENNLKQFEKTVDLQTSSSEISYKNSIQSLNSQKRNMELAKEVARVTRIKYTSGLGSNIEVINAESSLKESQINYYNALYDALVQKVDYDKSQGNLK